MNKKFKLEVIPFGAKIWILIGYSEDFIENAKYLRLSKNVKEDVAQYVPKTYKACVYYNLLGKPELVHFVSRNHSTAMHEVHHVVELCGRYYGFSRCLETKAYLQEYLLKLIKQKFR